MSTFGTRLTLSLFGESHGPCTGLTIHNFPPGVPIDHEAFQKALASRRPDQKISGARIEEDRYTIESGVFHERTTGAPITIRIENKHQRSEHYEKGKIRPGHADYTAYMKYKGYNDYRGGGHFSGRLTAPLVILGVLCDSLLAQKDIRVISHIKQIHTSITTSFTEKTPDEETLKRLSSSHFPVLEKDMETTFTSIIRRAKDEGDSVGGIVETLISGIDAGLGEPFFDTFESILSHLLFAIPGVKGVQFGKGYELSAMKGSESNDSIRYEAQGPSFDSHHMGGVLGGITTGSLVIFDTAIKPTPSINKTQASVDIERQENVSLRTEGRHDACIVPRALPVIEALTKYAIVEMLFRNEAIQWN